MRQSSVLSLVGFVGPVGPVGPVGAVLRCTVPPLRHIVVHQIVARILSCMVHRRTVHRHTVHRIDHCCVTHKQRCG